MRLRYGRRKGARPLSERGDPLGSVVGVVAMTPV
jgi:hypothetical protein